MSSKKNPSWVRTAGIRSIIVVALIAVVVPFWIYLIFFTQLPMLALALIALVILLLLSTATAWTATAIPRRDSRPEDDHRD
ncbi:MAG: hypothetical protein V2J10_08620 [Wenzhouxiangella sp.]|nr:hypothetical protein [Wenzhouxiangella sp.]